MSEYEAIQAVLRAQEDPDEPTYHDDLAGAILDALGLDAEHVAVALMRHEGFPDATLRDLKYHNSAYVTAAEAFLTNLAALTTEGEQ